MFVSCAKRDWTQRSGITGTKERVATLEEDVVEAALSSSANWE